MVGAAITVITELLVKKPVWFDGMTKKMETKKKEKAKLDRRTELLWSQLRGGEQKREIRSGDHGTRGEELGSTFPNKSMRHSLLL